MEKCSCKERCTNFNMSFLNPTFKIYGDLDLNASVILKYTGKLIDKTKQDQKIFLTCGYGKIWDEKQTIEMTKCNYFGELEYCCELSLSKYDVLYICFMDNNNSWDLSDGSSYFLNIPKPPEKKEIVSTDLVPIEQGKQGFVMRLLRKIRVNLYDFIYSVENTFERLNIEKR